MGDLRDEVEAQQEEHPAAEDEVEKPEEEESHCGVEPQVEVGDSNPRLGFVLRILLLEKYLLHKYLNH